MAWLHGGDDDLGGDVGQILLAGHHLCLRLGRDLVQAWIPEKGKIGDDAVKGNLRLLQRVGDTALARVER